MKISGLVLSILTICLSSCSLISSFPELPTDPMQESDISAARAFLLEQNRQLKSFRILYEVKPLPPEPTFRYAAVFKAPDKFRVELFPLQGFYSLGLFLTTPGKALFMDPNARQVLYSKHPDKLFVDTIGIPFSPIDTAYIFSGRIPEHVLNDNEMQWFALSPARIAIVDSNRTQYWEVHTDMGKLRRIQIIDDFWGSLEAEVIMHSSAEVNNIFIVDSLTVNIPLADLEYQVNAKAIKAQDQVLDNLFTIDVPRGFKYIEQF